MSHAPSYVNDDAATIRQKAAADRVIVEDAVDDEWFIRVEGPTESLDESEFDSMVEMVRDEIGDQYHSFKVFYDVGAGTSKYLIRIEYE